MDKKEIKITIPEGYEIDKENSTFEKIVFKKIESTRWRDNVSKIVDGFYISSDSEITHFSGRYHDDRDCNVFATKKQAKAALAMARISQIMTNDERFGGIVTDEEWEDSAIIKYVIYRFGKKACPDIWNTYYHFLSFHTEEQRDLFLKENINLVKDYLMIE